MTFYENDLTTVWRTDWKEREEKAGEPVRRLLPLPRPETWGLHRSVVRG